MLVHVLSRIADAPVPINFSNRLYSSRYEMLYPMDSLWMQREMRRFQCFVDTPQQHTDIIKK